MKKRCTKGKSCSSTCIVKSYWCIVELGPNPAKALSKLKINLGSQFAKQVAAGDKEPSKPKSMPADLRNALAGLPKPPSTSSLRTSEMDRMSPPQSVSPTPRTSQDNTVRLISRELKRAVAAGDKEAEQRAEAALNRMFFPNSPAPVVLEGRKLSRPPEKSRQISMDVRKNPVAVAEEKLRVAREQKDTKGIQDAKKELDAAKKANPSPKVGLTTLEKGKDPVRDAKYRAELAAEFKREQDKIVKPAAPARTPNNYISSATGNTRYAKQDARDADKELQLNDLKREGDKNYNGWKDSSGSKARKVGEGSYGTVIRNPDGTFVKRGAISNDEAKLIKILGDAGIGPKLIAADINGKHEWQTSKAVDIRNGRIAMTQVEGKPLGKGTKAGDIMGGGKTAADVYWTAMAKLHRLGIAHNDAHIENIMVDNKGTGRWIDMGMAQKNPKAALLEVMGAFDSKKLGEGGNWQTKRWEATGVNQLQGSKTRAEANEFLNTSPALKRVVAGRSEVLRDLKAKGYSDADVASMFSSTQIRSRPSDFTKNAWATMTDKQAQGYLDKIYQGIES